MTPESNKTKIDRSVAQKRGARAAGSPFPVLRFVFLLLWFFGAFGLQSVGRVADTVRDRVRRELVEVVDKAGPWASLRLTREPMVDEDALERERQRQEAISNARVGHWWVSQLGR